MLDKRSYIKRKLNLKSQCKSRENQKISHFQANKIENNANNFKSHFHNIAPQGSYFSRSKFIFKYFIIFNHLEIYICDIHLKQLALYIPKQKKQQSAACNFTKKYTPTQVFYCEFFEMLKNTFFTEPLRATVSVYINFSSFLETFNSSYSLETNLNTSPVKFAYQWASLKDILTSSHIQILRYGSPCHSPSYLGYFYNQTRQTTNSRTF